MGISTRYARLGPDDRAYRLSLSRQDLGITGLALETVSRLFLRFQDDGLIEVRGRSVQLLDPQRLRTLAIGGSESRHRCCA